MVIKIVLKKTKSVNIKVGEIFYSLGLVGLVFIDIYYMKA